jgi:hypothetical protein
MVLRERVKTNHQWACCRRIGHQLPGLRELRQVWSQLELEREQQVRVELKWELVDRRSRRQSQWQPSWSRQMVLVRPLMVCCPISIHPSHLVAVVESLRRGQQGRSRQGRGRIES